MRKVIWSVVAFAMFAVLLVSAATAQVYFVPQSSSAERGNTTEVEIRVNATNFASGGINMSYHPGCANVTNWKRNVAQFPLGTWAHYDGYDKIGFVGMDLKDGDYPIGTLTISCVCDSKCATPLDFEEDCKVVNDYGESVPVDFIDGTFECIKEVPEECLGDCYDMPSDGHNCTGKIIARDVTCYECLSAGTGASWHPTTHCPDRDLYCPNWCFNECPACADGIDNDQDGRIDCPADDGCACCCDYTETPEEIDPCGEVPEECLGDCYDTPANGTNCTGVIIDTNVTCYECLVGGMGASWHPTTRCPDRDLYCPDWCFNECPACADRSDNDKDGLIDCPEDDGCACCCDYTEDTDEVQPCVPELPTIALTGIGILSLVLWVRSRRGQKRE